MAIPTEKRAAAIAALEAGEGNLAEVAARFGVGRASLARWVARGRKGEGISPLRPPGGRPALDEAGRAALLFLAHSRPGASAAELAPELARVTGRSIAASTIARHLRALRRDGAPPAASEERADRGSAGRGGDEAPVARKARGGRRARAAGKSVAAPETAATAQAGAATAAASALDVGDPGVCDREWDLLRDVFEPRGVGSGSWPARSMLACLRHVVRTGDWGALPPGSPPAEVLRLALAQWTAEGRIARMHEVVRDMWEGLGVARG